jgi:hypothetical protein
MEWALSRDGQHLGMPLVHGGSQRLVVFDGAKSVGMPSVDCVFEVSGSGTIVIHDLEFH